MRPLALLPLLALALGCGEDFKPASVVEGFRVLGINAEPAELHPGQRATLTALVVNPASPGAPRTLLWLGCAPDPYAQGRSACSDIAAFQDASSVLQGEGGALALPPGMSLLGFGDRVGYATDPALFSVLPPEDPRRVSGTVGQVLLLAVAGELPLTATPEERDAFFARVRSRELPSVFVLFRIRVTEEVRLNQNPSLSELLVDGVAQPAAATVRLAPDRPSDLELTAPDEALEVYSQRSPQGVEEEKTERLLAAWYATAGRFSEERLVLRGEFRQSYAPPTGTEKDPLPEDRRGTLWMVVRDTRGGTVWSERALFFCDSAAPAPVMTGIEPASGKADGFTRLKVTGEGLDGTLEVLVGGLPLKNAAVSAGAFEGVLPQLPAGAHAVQLRARSCVDPEVRATYQVVP